MVKGDENLKWSENLGSPGLALEYDLYQDTEVGELKHPGVSPEAAQAWSSGKASGTGCDPQCDF